MIADHLGPEQVKLEGEARTKRGVLEELARLLAASSGLPVGVVLEGLLEREEVMSTGIGHGVAIPHARLPAAQAMSLALVRYPDGVEFRSVDGRPVHLAFGVIGPPQGTGLHVKLLARLARLVKEPGAVAEVMEAGTRDEVLDVLRRRDA